MRTRTWLKAVATVALLTTLAGCGGVASKPTPAPGAQNPGGQAPAEVNQQIVQANTRFGISLFQALYKEKPAENLFLSPISASMVLSLTLNGADGATREAMRKTLSLEGVTPEQMNAGNRALLSVLTGADEKVQVNLANSVWYRDSMKVHADFAQIAKQSYQAQVEPLAFEKASAPGTINKWVEKSTKGKIPKIIERINPDDVMFLLNAVYFNGTWSQPFEEAATQRRPFTTGEGARKDHPLMRRGGSFRYLKEDGLQAVRLPYGSGRVALYVFLPDQMDGFAQSLTAEKLDGWISRMQAKQGSVALPKLKLETDRMLNDSLKAMGMAPAFDETQADFSRLFAGEKRRLFISAVQQKTYLDMNERGTEAAAVTSVAVSVTSAPADPFQMVVDRPYLMVIRDDTTGLVLFMGAITDPQ